MKVEILAGDISLGTVEARVLDASMGVIGGTLQASNEYLADFQGFFRAHLEQPDCSKLRSMALHTRRSTLEEVEAAGGICITDMKGFKEIEVEICGVDSQLIDELCFMFRSFLTS